MRKSLLHIAAILALISIMNPIFGQSLHTTCHDGNTWVTLRDTTEVDSVVVADTSNLNVYDIARLPLAYDLLVFRAELAQASDTANVRFVEDSASVDFYFQTSDDLLHWNDVCKISLDSVGLPEYQYVWCVPTGTMTNDTLFLPRWRCIARWITIDQKSTRSPNTDSLVLSSGITGRPK
jgi:hypothetical protein